MSSHLLFRGLIEVSYETLLQHYGEPTLDQNGKVTWLLDVNNKQYKIEGESSSYLTYKWKVYSKFKDLSDLEEYFENL